MFLFTKQKTRQLLAVAAGAVMAFIFFDPFTVKSIGNIVLKGDRLSQSYYVSDPIKTGSIGNRNKDQPH